MTTPTQLPVPSESPRDLKFNAGKIDEFVTSLALQYIDRLGGKHYTIEGLRWLIQQAISSYGWIPVGTFQDGETLTQANQILKNEDDGDYYRWDGLFPKLVPVDSTPETTGGFGVGAWLSVGDSTLRSALASMSLVSPGSNLIGMPTGETLTSYLSTGRGIDPRMPPYNYRSGDSLAVRTAAVQQAFEDANVNKKSVFLTGFFNVDHLLLSGHTDYSLSGFGGFIFNNTTGYGLEMKNCRNITVPAGISINATRTTAIKVWGQSEHGGTSLLNLGFTVIGASRAWEFGDASEPDCLVSEIVVRGGYTIDCGEVYYAYGSQTVIEFNSYQLIAGGNTTPNGPSGQVRVGTNVGAVVHINGGEVMKTVQSDGGMFTLHPIESPLYDNAYGKVFINGSAIESASTWLVAYNPDGVLNIMADSGGLVISGCHGYYGHQLINFQVADSFTGELVVLEDCKFHRLNQKTTGIVTSSGGAAPVCNIADSAFDHFFPKGFQKYNGICVPLFKYQRIGKASNLAGQSITGSNNQTDLKFTAVSSLPDEDNTLFLTNYNPTTGTFTTPKGGLKDVCIYVQWDVSTTHSGSDLNIMIGGTQSLAVIEGSARRVNGFVTIGNLAAGETVTLRYQNGGASFNCYSKNDDYFVMFARR